MLNCPTLLGVMMTLSSVLWVKSYPQGTLKAFKAQVPRGEGELVSAECLTVLTGTTQTGHRLHNIDQFAQTYSAVWVDCRVETSSTNGYTIRRALDDT
jgi:hypothetical protein